MTTSKPLSGLRVLVAEDEYFVAQDVAIALAQCGAQIVGPVATLPEAMELAREPLDAAVLDINLRGMLVYPLADLLASRGVALVFATGYGAAAIPARFEHIRRCEKPVEIGEISAALFPGGPFCSSALRS